VVAVQLAGLAAADPPPVPEPAVVVVVAADHGVHAQGVSPWPQEVTAQMVANLAAGGAVVNALAAQTGARVLVVDVGSPGTSRRSTACSTARSARAPPT
jgi:nicotinate-nucleotide--dimethylbenzimidazole phosphoribosyltransferase